MIAEAVQEFQIQTNPYSAENGRNTGAAINVGTNQVQIISTANFGIIIAAVI